MAKRKLEVDEAFPSAAVQGRWKKDFPSLFLWPAIHLQKLAMKDPDIVKCLIAKYQAGLHLSTDYSGVGSAELVCQFIQEALQQAQP